MFVCLNGKFLKAGEAKVSIFDHGFLYGDGVYETLRTYGGKVWQLEEHLKRLEQSSRSVGLSVPVSHETIEKWVHKLLKKNDFKESRVRITLTRGVNSFDFSSPSKPTFLIQADELHPQPATVYKNGVKVVTVRLERAAPEIKSTSLLPMIMAQQHIKKARAYEGLFVDRASHVREGTITNVFMVKNNVLFTPKSRILKGTTRHFVMKLARAMSVRVQVVDFTVRKLKNADELFITNAVRGIIPVRQLDDHLYGRPGPVTQQLMKTFDETLKKTCR